VTEYEILDVIGVNIGNLITGTGVYFTVLTGYLIVAYTVGIKLTKYQVSFINIVFLLYSLMSAANFSTMIIRNLVMSGKLSSLTGTSRLVGDEGSAAIVSLFILMRVLLVIGAIIFMWQVRHPKAE